MAEPATGSARAPLEPALRQELLARAKRDQDARHAHSDAVERGEGDWSPVAAVDADNLAFLTPLLEQYGWLGSDLVGDEGANACWLLVQHSPPNRQDAWLPRFTGPHIDDAKWNGLRKGARGVAVAWRRSLVARLALVDAAVNVAEG